MTIAQATLVQRIRLHLGDLPWETTGSAVDGTTPYIAVADGAEWEKGNIGEFYEDGDSFRTSSISGNTLSTVRSYYGSTGATHAASSRILKNPKYRYSEIVNAISATIQSALPWPRVYKVTADTVTPVTNTKWYDLAADALGLVSVFQLDDSSPTGLHAYGERHATPRVMFERNLPTAIASSGVGVGFPDWFHDSNNTVYINYAAKITDTVTTQAYVDFSDGDAVTEAIIYGTVAMLEGSLELRKPRRPSPDTEVLRGYSLFARRFESALATAEKEVRLRSPLMQPWKGPI